MNIQNRVIFWTGLMRDHSIFIYNSLSVSEVETIQKADAFKELFTKLKLEANQSKNNKELVAKANTLIGKFITYKKSILQKLLNCKIGLAMTPTFINHMINEAYEFYYDLQKENREENKALDTLRLHKIWLPDSAGHAKFIASQLDGIESRYDYAALEFMQSFDQLFNKAFEMYIMFERTSIQNGSLNKFNNDVKMVLQDFIGFLNDVETNRKECALLATGTFEPLILDHMIREANYYLNNI
ncbi:MAG TPA: DUF2935 domain-containing protein [Acholeplasmataceae bacterium]|jgi:hypothetical protein|nr:DUF2935 domain-containing protein [Acholeplasmataceae bacterium]